MYIYVLTRYNHVLKINEKLVMSCSAKLTYEELEMYKNISGWELIFENQSGS